MDSNKDILINVFFAYSREDSELRILLEKHLSALRREKFIQMWYDGKIDAGKEWEMEINSNLSKADVILLLISADFIASDYCYEVEMRKAISRHNTGDAVVIPILLKPCDWFSLPFAKIQALPQNGKPVISSYWGDKDIAFTEIATSIRSIVTELRVTKGKELNSITSLLKDKENDLKVILNLITENQFEIEVQNEEISTKCKILNKINDDYISAENIYIEKYSQLESSIKELENTFLSKKEEYDKIIGQKQIEINRLRSDERNTTLLIEKLKNDIRLLETKKTNIEEDIKRIKR